MTGGIDLAAEWAGFETVGQCEWADYPTKVLEKHWPDVPRWRDVRSVTKESFTEKTGLRTVDIISGGFPCQPFSVAGQQRGEEDDRYLWPEMLRVIQELQPSWVIGENVPGIINMALEQVLSDLENEGYEVQAFIIPAAGVGALHRRKRVFILGHSKHNGFSAITQLRSYEETSNQWRKEEQDKAGESEGTDRPFDVSSVCRCEDGIKQNVAYPNPARQLQPQGTIGELWRWASNGGQDVANANKQGLQGCRRLQKCTGEWITWEGSKPLDSIWEFEPDVGRVATRISSRVDRLKCLGNAVVPQQVYPILQVIADIERSQEKTG